MTYKDIHIEVLEIFAEGAHKRSDNHTIESYYADSVRAEKHRFHMRTYLSSPTKRKEHRQRNREYKARVKAILKACPALREEVRQVERAKERERYARRQARKLAMLSCGNGDILQHR